MKTSFKEIDELFDFKGLWDVPSKCGLKILQKTNTYTIIVSELYKDNPGTSVTQAACTLAKQICEKFDISLSEITYIEHNPDMNSKLSFYDEEFYLVNFDINDGSFVNPQWTKINREELTNYYK